MNKHVDHTHELERRISVISIAPRDSCSFIKLKDNPLAAMKECWYCVYAEFEKDNNDLLQQGVCRFK